jgi:hypothetical protein
VVLQRAGCDLGRSAVALSEGAAGESHARLRTRMNIAN